jgi:carbon dioxide concentrating mechanism protein CcmO
VAIEAGMHEAERIGELHAVMVIPRLLDDLETIIPVASYWLDQAETPLPNLSTIATATTQPEEARRPLELPQVEREAVPIEQAEAIPVEVEVERIPSVRRADDPSELF